MKSRRQIRVSIKSDSKDLGAHAQSAVDKNTKTKKTPATDKEELFRWAENFVRKYDEDFKELARR